MMFFCFIGNTPVLRWNTTGITVAGIVNNPGDANNQLDTPVDAALDDANNLYIVDQNNHRIQKYLLGVSTGQTIAGNTTPGTSQYELYGPAKILLDANGNFYVSDLSNQRIQYWQNGATSGQTVAGITS